MNQSALLAQIRTAVGDVRSAESTVQVASAADRLVDLFESLDAELSKGCTLPDAWRDATADYRSPDPLPPKAVTVGRRVRVPLWYRGDVVRWQEGTVTEVEAGVPSSPEQKAIVRFVDGTSALYLPYSVEAV